MRQFVKDTTDRWTALGPSVAMQLGKMVAPMTEAETRLALEDSKRKLQSAADREAAEARDPLFTVGARRA